MIERWVFQANKPKQGYLDEKPSSQKRKKYTKQNIATFECRNKDNQRKKSINHVKIGRRSMMVAKIELLTKERQLEAESSNYFNNNGGIFTFSEFTKFRWQYILAYIGIMLADGLQGMCSLEAKSGMYVNREQKIRRNECSQISQFSHPCKSSPTLAQALIFMSYMKDTASRSPPSIRWDLSRGPSHHPSPELSSTGSAERRQPCYTAYWKSSSTTWSSIPYSRGLC